MAKVLLGMSGGVDSSTAAALLMRAGHEVIGATLVMHDIHEKDAAAAKDVADAIGIPHHTVDMREDFESFVLSPFVSEYENGRTPNPCVICNGYIKFPGLIRLADRLGCEYIATGHYCDILHDGDTHYLLKAKDQNKDQTYFLNQLSQAQLDKVLFPLGKLDKSEVRRIAEKNGLATAEKKDSTGICFIGERNFRNFLQNYIPNKKGKIMTYDGKVLGEHLGLMYYTIGQRRGLGIGGQAGDDGSRWFVIEKDLKNKILELTKNEEYEEIVKILTEISNNSSNEYLYFIS